MYLLTFLIIILIIIIVNLIKYLIRELKKPKGESFDIKGSFKKIKQEIKELDKLKIKNFLFGTNFKRGFLTQLIIYLLLISIGFIYLYPILYMISTAFKSASDIVNPAVSWVPTQFYLGNFKRAFKVLRYFEVLRDSLLVTLLPAIIQTIICSFIGYGFAKFNFKFKGIILVLVILTFIIPAQVYMIPKYQLFYQLKLLNTPWAIILPSIFGQGLNSAIFILIFFQFFRMIPNSLNEAAEIDGAGPYRTFFTIAIPLAGQSFLICFLFGFVWYWNETYMLSLFAADYPNLQIRLSSFVAEYSEMYKDESMLKLNEGVRLAATLLILIPMLLIYLVMQKWFVEGIERSGITGE